MVVVIGCHHHHRPPSLTNSAGSPPRATARRDPRTPDPPRTPHTPTWARSHHSRPSWPRPTHRQRNPRSHSIGVTSTECRGSRNPRCSCTRCWGDRRRVGERRSAEKGRGLARSQKQTWRAWVAGAGRGSGTQQHRGGCKQDGIAANGSFRACWARLRAAPSTQATAVVLPPLVCARLRARSLETHV